MYKNLFMTAALMVASLQVNAQTAAPDFKGADNNNPISANVFCADPTALEYNGRLYVYGSNDHQETGRSTAPLIRRRFAQVGPIIHGT